MISFLTIPYYLCVRDKKRLQKFTRRFNIGLYFFFSIIISSLFLMFNLILVPFAYLKTCYHKIKLAHAKRISIADVVFYILVGLVMGIIVQIPDMWAFLKSSWSMKKPKRT